MAINKPILYSYNPALFADGNIIPAGGANQTVSQNFQFNLYTPSKGGAIYVDGNNFGYVEFTLPDGKTKQGKGAWALEAENPPGTFGQIHIVEIPAPPLTSGNSVVRFELQPGGVPGPATVILKLSVTYG